MLPGRRPLPTPLKIMRGTLNTTKANKNEAKLPVKVPPPPKFLTGEEKKWYKRMGKQLVVAGLMTVVDGLALAMLSRALCQYIKAGGNLNDTGLVVKLKPKEGEGEQKEGYIMQHPYYSVQNKAFDQIFKLLVEFGQTPSSRSRVRSTNETPEDKLQRFTG